MRALLVQGTKTIEPRGNTHHVPLPQRRPDFPADKSARNVLT
jgi:hypothetical protein